MKKNLRKIEKYIGFVSLGLQKTFTYRFSFFLSFLSSIVQAVVLYWVWLAVYRGKVEIENFTLPMMITYLIISQGISNLYGFTTSVERRIFEKVRSGNLTLDLVKPVNFGLARFAETIGQLSIQALLTGIIMVILKIFIPYFLLPYNLYYFIAFIFSVFLGFMIMFSIGTMVGCITFYIMSYWGIYYARKAVVDFFSGAIIPLFLFPKWLMDVSNFLPFKNIVFIPVMIYLGEYDFHDTFKYMSIQLLWGVFLIFTAQFVYSRLIRRISINGG